MCLLVRVVLKLLFGSYNKNQGIHGQLWSDIGLKQWSRNGCDCFKLRKKERMGFLCIRRNRYQLTCPLKMSFVTILLKVNICQIIFLCVNHSISDCWKIYLVIFPHKKYFLVHFISNNKKSPRSCIIVCERIGVLCSLTERKSLEKVIQLH